MPSEPDWGKWGTIATLLVGFPMLALGILSYVRPPDPNHPMKLDFLTQTVQISVWLALTVILLVSILSAIVSRRLSPGIVAMKAQLDAVLGKLKEEQKLGEQYRLRQQRDQREIANRDDQIAGIERAGAECELLKKQITDLQNRNATLRAQLETANREPIKQSALFYGGGLPIEKLPEFDLSAERLVLAWPEEFQVRIWRHQDHGTQGLLFEIANLRTTWIGSYTLEIAEATSWDERHAQFRESRYFTPFQVAHGKEIGPAQTTGGQWFLRIKDGTIVLGNSQAPELNWPSEDASTVQVWRLALSLCVDEHHKPNNNLNMLKRLSPVMLLIRWDKSADGIAMAYTGNL